MHLLPDPLPKANRDNPISGLWVLHKPDRKASLYTPGVFHTTMLCLLWECLSKPTITLLSLPKVCRDPDSLSSATQSDTSRKRSSANVHRWRVTSLKPVRQH